MYSTNTLSQSSSGTRSKKEKLYLTSLHNRANPASRFASGSLRGGNGLEFFF